MTLTISSRSECHSSNSRSFDHKRTMPFSSPVRAPSHILELLNQLHQQSLVQEAAINPTGKFTSTDKIGDAEDKLPAFERPDFDDIMRDKFIALDQDKCHFVYQLIGAMGATNVVEAGTSFGVSTIYLALAVAQNNAAQKKQGKVFATEKEPEKAAKAQRYWKECGKQVEEVIDLRVGDLLETLTLDLPEIDLLLLDSEFVFHTLALQFISRAFVLITSRHHAQICAV